MNLVKSAEDLGFVAAGFSPCDVPLFFDAFCSWVDAGKFGQMTWVKRHRDLRKDPGRLLENCRTIISLAYPYRSKKPYTPDGFSVSRYSEPQKEDYHLRLRRKAEQLAARIRSSFPEAKTRVCVDSAPLLERSFAYRSGLGFVGKNNMLIVPGKGSYLFLTEILTTADLPFENVERSRKDPCEGCTRCLDACPTGALTGPRRFDASKCLSYLTIEHDGKLDFGTGKRMGGCFLGCDICQEVCPYNKIEGDGEIILPGANDFLGMNDDAFETLFGKTALARPGLKRIKRNIRAIHA